MDPFSDATAGSLFAPPPRPFLPPRSSSMLMPHSTSRQGSRSPMPARPDADDPFFTAASLTTSHPPSTMPHLSHPAPQMTSMSHSNSSHNVLHGSAPIPHTSVPFAPTELAVLQRWSQVYHAHRARCPVGPPPGMPAAVYDIFERLGGAASFTTQNGDYSASTQIPPQSASQQNSGNDDSEAFRPEAWSSGTGAQSEVQPTPGLYRSPDGEGSAPSSSPPTHTLRSSGSGGTRPHVYGIGNGMPGVRLGSSPSYGALDQHMRTLELKRGMKRSASGLGRAKTNRVVSAPVGGARPSGEKASSSTKGSSPLVGMKGSSPMMSMKHSSPPLGLRHSSPLVGLNSGMDYDSNLFSSGGFQTGVGAQNGANYQTYGDAQQPSSQGSTATTYTEGQTAYAAPEGQSTYSFTGAYGDSQNSYTDAQSAFLDAQRSYNAQDGEEDENEPSQSQETQDENEASGPTGTSSTTSASNAAPKEKGKARVSGTVPDRTDPNTMPDRNDPNVTIIEDAATLRGMRYEDFEPHMFIGRGALGTEYPRNLEPGAGHERIRCLLCKCGYAGPNGRSMWRRHVSQKHVILLAGKRGTVTKKKEGLPDEAAVITTYIEKRERTLASKKRYASKKRMDQKLDRLAAQGFDV
ncbi:hypothetical protein BDV93DRAFT_117459 [Ceratobasidium sp. AG-I]|nr:hypothetical protein BDV93DRAFT_117459 [Ceratobasidium sp. AG-I]